MAVFLGFAAGVACFVVRDVAFAAPAMPVAVLDLSGAALLGTAGALRAGLVLVAVGDFAGTDGLAATFFGTVVVLVAAFLVGVAALGAVFLVTMVFSSAMSLARLTESDVIDSSRSRAPDLMPSWLTQPLQAAVMSLNDEVRTSGCRGPLIPDSEDTPGR
ncbi:hypothetical protein CKO25_13785 [Thiocapsa imhoffii]|uniref:Uncharacterized protein n=1 Tax=Thiocapsa imhoffii TaxID=382777 RepID=A0A9X0WJM7_9GAMM|nr:hypothetical protein [Thiocapsa imhoffii]